MRFQNNPFGNGPVTIAMSTKFIQTELFALQWYVCRLRGVQSCNPRHMPKSSHWHICNLFILILISQNFDLVSHTTYVVRVSLMHEPRYLQFKVDSERLIFRKLFMVILFTLGVFPRNLLNTYIHT